MRRRLASTAAIAAIAFGSATVDGQSKPASSSPLVARVDQTGFIQLRADSFSALAPRQQALAYWLSQASIAIDPIIYNQLSSFGIREKRLLEGIVARPAGIDAATLRKIREFALLFWANRGNHNEQTSRKFLPSFTADDLETAAQRAQANGAFQAAYADLPALRTPDDLRKELQDLRPALFDANFESMITAKTPPPGKDILQASSNTFYEGVTLADLQSFTEHYPLNSRIVKDAGARLREDVYRAGTADGSVPPGLYATYLKKAIQCLQQARMFAGPAQAKVIADLIRFYQTGDPEDWLTFGVDWVRNDEPVDFVNGFIEVYRDARGRKGSSQSFVTVTDQHVTAAMKKLAHNAAYFEQKAPWDSKYKKHTFQAPVVKAVEVIIETGDFHVSTIGDNLPNENSIHEKYGTKNFLLLGSSHALDAAGSSIDEFGATQAEVARNKKYGEEAEDLLTAMHEVIGHGSGKLTERTKTDPQVFLKEYYSTLEEARADLMGLWNVWDPKLKELGLVKDQDDVAKAMYDNAARAALTQLRRNPKGDTLEEDHQRDRQLIVNFVMDKTGGIKKIEQNGKTYLVVSDYQKMRKGVGELLAELMRIKAEGDYSGIKALVDAYGVHFDPALRDQVVARYAKLDIPTYWAGVNPAIVKSGGAYTIEYPADPVRQYLSYGAMYDQSLAPAQPPSPRRRAGRGRP
jgi:dipeptidyl-peptidase III